MRRIPGWRRNVAALVSSTFLFGAAFSWTPRIAAQQGSSTNSGTQTTKNGTTQVGSGSFPKVRISTPVGQDDSLPPATKRDLKKLAGTIAPPPEVLKALIARQRIVSAQHLANHPRVGVARHLLQTDPNAPNPTLPTFDWS